MAKTHRHQARVLPKVEGGRVETGPVQFGDDWPGVFIRGDNALLGYANYLQEILTYVDEDKVTNIFALGGVQDLISLLHSCAVKPE